MTINSTFSAIINAPVTYKKKGTDGKYIVMTTTALDDSFKHCPKSKDCADDAKTALNNLDKVYEYMEAASLSRTDNQRDKAVNKAHDFARSYLKAVGLGCGVGNITMITALFAPKRQTKTNKDTKEKTILGGYTTKSTFVKYALYLTNHVLNGGAWCDPKTSAKSKSTEKDALWAEMEENKRLYNEQKAQNEAMYTFIMTDPKLKAAFEAMAAKR